MAQQKIKSIYEINTWVWLAGLSARSKSAIDLGSVPTAEWDAIAAYGFDTVWLMGVWERSPAGREIATRNAGLMQDFLRALPDFRPEDNVGSAYCVRSYEVDSHLGGPVGLAAARKELRKRGMALLLDFVPNHMAPDAPWITEHPDHFIRGTAADLKSHPGWYLQLGSDFFACGRDPYFPPWPDVIQVNAFHAGFRQAALQRMLKIAEQCDGVRCDMAMLLMNRVFATTWGQAAGAVPELEFWPELIAAVKRQSPDFQFVAEAYWALEWDLQQQGFDFCYDKKLYDLLEQGNAGGMRLHLGADLSFQQKLIRFIENHDEPRAAVTLPGAKEKAAAIAIATLPGASLFYEGQFEGRRTRVPVFLGRAAPEGPDGELKEFYQRLLSTVKRLAFRDGQWALCTATGWPDNQTCQNLAVWSWSKNGERWLVLINYSDANLQARVHTGWDDLAGKAWRIEDALSDAKYERDGSEMQNDGLYVELAPWMGQMFALTSLAVPPLRPRASD